jgi:hypothetical protein
MKLSGLTDESNVLVEQHAHVEGLVQILEVEVVAHTLPSVVGVSAEIKLNVVNTLFVLRCLPALYFALALTLAGDPIKVERHL